MQFTASETEGVFRQTGSSNGSHQSGLNSLQSSNLTLKVRRYTDFEKDKNVSGCRTTSKYYILDITFVVSYRFFKAH